MITGKETWLNGLDLSEELDWTCQSWGPREQEDARCMFRNFQDLLCAQCIPVLYHVALINLSERFRFELDSNTFRVGLDI